LRISAFALAALSIVCTLPASAAAQSTPDVASFRTFASWPDDAQVLSPGTGVVSMSLSTWRWAFGSGVSFPALYGSVGIAPHTQISATFERDHSTYTDGTTTSSIGDRYIIGKIALFDPDKYPIGVAISPMLQILGDESLTYYRYYKSSDTSRVQFALPVHVQFPAGKARVSASAGVFSVGSTFISGGIEAPINARLVVNGSISHSYSTETALFSEATDVSRRRVDANAGAWVILSPAAFLFGSIGRTISHADQNGMTLSASFGLAVYIGR